jgi:hypothetical protein
VHSHSVHGGNNFSDQHSAVCAYHAHWVSGHLCVSGTVGTFCAKGLICTLICAVGRSPAKFRGELCKVCQRDECVESGGCFISKQMRGLYRESVNVGVPRRRAPEWTCTCSLHCKCTSKYIGSAPQIFFLDNGHAMPSIKNCSMRPSIMELTLRINTSPSRDKDAVECGLHRKVVCDHVLALATMGICVEYAMDTG